MRVKELLFLVLGDLSRGHLRGAAKLICEPDTEEFDTLVIEKEGQYRIKEIPGSGRDLEEVGVIATMSDSALANLKIESFFRLDNPANQRYVAKLILHDYLFFKEF